MAAVLTLSAPVVAADGKTITATIAGGTAPYSISSVAGLVPHLATGDTNGFVVSSVSVSGSTLTVVCGSSIGTGESIRLNITTGATLTDSAANTPTGQTDLVATNNSAVVVTTFGATTSPFELNGSYTVASGGKLRGPAGLGPWTSSFVDNAAVEFVADATEVALIGYQGATDSAAVDGATTMTTLANNASAFWMIKPIFTGATAGNHLVLVNFGDYFTGVRLAGGASVLRTVPTTKATLLANTSTYPGIPASSPLTLSGAYKIVTAGDGQVSSGSSYVGLSIECQITGTGLEVASLSHSGNLWATSIDGGTWGAVLPTGDGTANNSLKLIPLAAGLAPGTHTLKTVLVSIGANTPHRAVRVINGTTITVASNVGDASITVASASTLAVNDWIRVDTFSKREWRKITGISGTGVTLNATLAQAHAVGATVTSYMAAAGSLSTWAPTTRTKKLMAMGDSNTEGANEYGLGGPGGVPPAGSPDANGNYYSGYDPRLPAVFLAGDGLNYEVINLGVQGNTSANMVTRDADFATLGHGNADYITIWAGTNDINGTTTTPSAFQANVESLVTAALPYLTAGGTIVLLPTGTPSTTNSAGLNNATVLTALQAVAANHASNTIVATNLLSGLVSGDYNNLHYMTSGRTKIAANLQPLIGGASATPAAVLTGMFAAV